MATTAKGKTGKTRRNDTGTKPAGDIVDLPAKTPIGKIGKEGQGLTCTGNICFSEDGAIIIDLTGSSCPPSAVKELAQRTLQGGDVLFKVGRSTLTGTNGVDLDLDWIESQKHALETLKLSKDDKDKDENLGRKRPSVSL